MNMRKHGRNLENAKLALPELPTPQEPNAKELGRLTKEVRNAQVALDEALQERKFRQSESDAINYKYQHSLHEAKAHSANSHDATVDKWQKKLADYESQIEGELTEAVLKAETTFANVNKALAQFYQTNGGRAECPQHLSHRPEI